jgi:hypothetical protein
MENLKNELITIYGPKTKAYEGNDGTIKTYGLSYYDYPDKIKELYELPDEDIIKQEDIINEAVNKHKEEAIKLIKEKYIFENYIELIQKAKEIKAQEYKIEKQLQEMKDNDTLNKYITPKERVGGWLKYEEINNATYSFWYYINESYRDGYSLCYYFTTSPLLKTTTNEHTKSIKTMNKKFKTIEEAEKYIEGRKKFFSKYFQEEKPAMILEAEHYVVFHGRTLKGYKVDNKGKV